MFHLTGGTVVTIAFCLLPTVCAVDAPVFTANTGSFSGDLGKEIEELMTGKEQNDGFSGVVFVARDGAIVISKGYGWADRANRIEYTDKTIFDIGSLTKQFTATAILKLELAGRLGVEDSISRFFKNVPADKQPITLHHLLTHLSGLRANFGGDYEEMSRDEIVRRALASKLLWPPGGGYRYSNAGYSLLGAIIEQVSGKGYEAYLRVALLLPAGMESTGYKLPAWQPESIAHGYRGADHWGTPLDKRWAADGPYWNLRCNGGILSTVGDLYKWHLALLGDTLLPPSAKDKLFTPHVKEEQGRSYYGYGWVHVKTGRGTQIITHNGGNDVFFADFRRYVDEGTVVIVASNTSDHSIQRFERALLNLIFPPAEPTS
jgi:CubicO group peptidase (beta-lactamase class C family)